jgi:hypothetical protein
MGTSAPTDTITALSTSNDHANESQLQLPLETKTQGFQSTGISTIDDLPMDERGPVTHHYTKKETLLPNKGTIKAPEVATPLKEQEHTLIHDTLESLVGRRPFSKISIQWECKSKCQCKDTLQIALEICIPPKEHLRPIDTPPHFRKTMWHNLNRTLQRCLKENSTH